MAKKRKSAMKNVCPPGACPGRGKHMASFIAGYFLIWYALGYLGVGGNLWARSLWLLVLGSLAHKWCPSACNCY